MFTMTSHTSAVLSKNIQRLKCQLENKLIHRPFELRIVRFIHQCACPILNYTDIHLHMHNERRRLEFFEKETLQPLKGYHARTAGGKEAAAHGW